MDSTSSEARIWEENASPESVDRSATADDDRPRNASGQDRCVFRVVELPEHGNQYQWTVAACLDGRTVGTGRHHLKRSAALLAEESAKKELEHRKVTERLEKSGLFDRPGKLPTDPPPSRKVPPKQRSSVVNRLHQTIRELSEERGKRAEDLVFQAFSGTVRDAPEWFRCVRRPTPEQDRFRQIDVIVETLDLGELYVQVKSSFSGLKHFMEEYHPANVRCIVVTPNLDDGYIRALVYDACNRLRDKRRRGEI